MKRVLIIIPRLDLSGPSKVVYNLVNQMNLNEFDIHLLAIKKSDTPKFKLGITKSINIHSLKDLRHVFLRIKKKVNLINPDVIHTHGFSPDFLAFIFFRNYKKISTIHGDLLQNYSDTYGRIIGFLLSKIQIKMTNSFNTQVACSATLAHLYKNKLTNLKHVDNGTETEYFKPLSKHNKAELRKKIDYPDGIIFVSISSLIERKDPLTIIKAFVKLSLSDSYLIFIGSGPLELKLRDYTKRYKNIIFLGYSENIKDYLCGADFFVSASQSEGLPNSVLEAQSCGIPTILSNIPSHRHIFDFEELSGLEFEVKNVDNLYQVMKNILSMNYDKLSANSRSNAVNRFSSSLMAEKYSALYK
ncbi:MAG: glycosyltransferase family 4 protein [Bacteroidota bacterium]